MEKDHNTNSSEDIEKFKIDASKVEKIKDDNGEFIKLGEGGLAIIYMASYGGRIVTVKQLEINKYIDKEHIINEIKIVMNLHHPSITKCYGYYEYYTNNKKIEIIGIINDFYYKGSLMDKINDPNSPPSYEMKMKWVNQIASAIDYLHSQNKVHRDLKPVNIFISDSDDAVLGEFGLARDFSCSSLNSVAGTLYYMAPEVINGESYTPKVDVYSYGIVLYEIIFNKTPYKFEQHQNAYEFTKKIVDGTLRPNLDFEIGNIPIHLISLMMSCWSACPNDRPSWDKIISTLKQK
jgi:serine/threonine protein kinase